MQNIVILKNWEGLGIRLRIEDTLVLYWVYSMFADNYYTLCEIIPPTCTQSTRAQLSSAPLSVDIEYLEDFYMTDPISRASQTMAKCTAAVKEDKTKNKY